MTTTCWAMGNVPRALENVRTLPTATEADDSEETDPEGLPVRSALSLRVLANDAALTRVALSGKTPEAVFDLAAALRTNTVVSSLDLRCNSLWGEGALTVANCLRGNRTLTSLDVGGNRIGDAGGEALGELLSDCALLSLDCWNNQLGQAGGLAIASAVATNRTLKFLNLGGNSIGFDAVHVLANALGETSSALTHLGLYGNAVQDDGALSLAAAIESNSALRVLDVGANRIGPRGTCALATALVQNCSLTDIGE